MWRRQNRVIQASKQTASFFNKISIATRNQNLVNRVIGGGGRISASCLLSSPHFYFWSNKLRTGNRWYNWWMKWKLNVTDGFTSLYRFILHHNRVPCSKILKGIEFRWSSFRGPKYRIFSRNLRNFFLFWPLKNRDA